eukprot:Sdes_comp19239_c0_seq1m10173
MDVNKIFRGNVLQNENRENCAEMAEKSTKKKPCKSQNFAANFSFNKMKISQEICFLMFEFSIQPFFIETFDEFASFLADFSQSVASFPYCKEFQTHFYSGHLKGLKSANSEQVFLNQLQCFSGITENLARAICFHYSSYSKLLDAFQKFGPDAISNLPRIEGFRKTIGNHISRKLHNFFTLQDGKQYI